MLLLVGKNIHMAIRMTDDPQDQNQNDYNDNSGGGGGNRPSIPGGGGGLIALLPMLLSLFKGKGIFLLLILGAGAYFLLGKGGGGCNVADIAQQFSQSGYNFSPEQFNKASVYEGLEAEAGKNPLPESVSLLRYAPTRGDQGAQGSCVAWSSAYAAQTILTAAATGADPNSIVFSPSYLYNQIKLDDCQGSYVNLAMEAMQKNGGVPLSSYPYNPNDCGRDASQYFNSGRQNTIHGYTRLTNGNTQTINVRAIKEHLSKDAPVVIGMMVGNSFMQDMMGKELWTPQGMDASMVGMGGHAMTIIGYDDRKFGGAFQIMNSWGRNWGKDGIGWVRYGDFQQYAREAYGIDALPKANDVAAKALECNIGLVAYEDVNAATKKYMQLRSTGGNSFQSVAPIKVGTRFKMEVTNATPCYVYIFSRQADGSSAVLFPYLKPGETVSKHSPYFGITGYRLFPKGQSMEADADGNKDYIAIVTSKSELDYNKLNQAISASAQTDYAAKVNDALKGILAINASISNTNDGRIYFKVNAGETRAVATVVAFDKVAK